MFALAPAFAPRAPASGAPRASGARRVVVARAAAPSPSPSSSRRVALALASSLAAFLRPRASDAAYGTSAGGSSDDAGASDLTWGTFYGAANPPATYGTTGGTTKSLAKYSYDVPSSWVEEATTKVEKGSGGQDSRWVKRGSRGEEKAYLLTLNRAGQDGAAFELTDASLQAVAGALSEMQDSIASGRVTSRRDTEDGREYALFDVDADRKYTVKISIDNTGRLFAFVVTAPASQFNRDKKVLDRMVDSFRIYTSASQFV
jgi:hypothetical protein